MKKRILSMILAIVMVAGMLPAVAFAAETDNLCDHHTEHTADCGYAPAVAGADCTHAHDEACGYMAAVEEVTCDCVAAEDGTLTHAEGCGYVAPADGSDCTHVHDEACGYAAAVEEQPCTYECAECAAVNEEPSEVTAAEITGLALIVDGTEHSSGLVTLTAASTVELKVYGTNLQYGTNDQQIWHLPDADVSLDSVYSWVVSSDGTYATISRDISYFCNIATPYTLQYSNNGKDFYDSNVSVIYDSSEDAAITGVSITVDGETCSSGNVTIYSDSVVTITVAGSNLQNATNDQVVKLKSDGTWSISGMTVSDDGTSATLEKTGDDFEGNENFEIRYCNDWITAETWQYTGIYLTYDDGTGDEPAVAATRVIYVDESTFFASGYSRFYDANENLLTATREEQEDGWVKYTIPADAKYYLTFDGHMGGGGGGNYPELPTNADTYDPFSDTWSCSHPGYAEGNCYLCGKPCPGHTGGTATCTTPAVCVTCGVSYGELNANNHNWENGVCTYECGTTHDPHTFENGTCTVCGEPCPGHSYENGTCTLCGEPCPGHSYENGTCTLCGEPCPGHTYDNACDAECNVCSEIRELGGHVYDNACDASCNNCDDIREVGDHVYDGAEDAECNECGYVRDITPAQITGVSITIDGVVYDSSNTSAEDPAVITPTSTVTLTVTGTSLHNGSDDHTVDYASGLYLYVNPDYFEISEDGTVATYEPSTGDFAKSSNFEITYCNNDTDTANRTVVPTGIYLTYDDRIAEEDKARITGMSITIDNVVYDSSNTSAEDPAVITPNTEFITITVHGTALQNCTTDHVVSYYSGSSEPILADYLWRFEADGTGAYHYYSSASALSDFARNTTPYELQYSNNGSFNAANPAIGSGVYIVYDDSTGSEEDTTPAEITGVTVTVDGVPYTSGNVTITPTSTITLTVTGTNLQNGTNDNRVNYADGFGQTVNRDYFEISEDGSTATCELSTADFVNSSNYEIKYYNNYTDIYNRTVVPTGIYLTYDDSTGGEEDTTPAEITGVSITVDGVTYTEGDVTITPTSTIIVTVTGTNFANLSAANILDLGPGLTVFMDTWRWETDPAANTATADFSDLNPEFGDLNGSEITYSNDSNQNWTGTGIYLTYDDGTGGEEDTTPAEITGVSITVDGETYTSGDVTITPDSTVILTVTGTNLQNGTDDNRVDYAYGVGQNVSRDYFEISEDGTVATYAPPVNLFVNSSNYEIKYYNNYTDTDNRTAISTGIYLTYDDEVNTTLAIGDNEIADGYTYTYTAEQDGSLYITVTELYYRGIGDVNEDNLGSWCAIEINGTAITEFANSTEVKTGDTVTVELISLDNDTYNGTVNLSWDASVMAEITGVSITVDGVEYVGSDTSAENPAVISSESASVILTVHGTNLQNATGDQWVSYMSTGNCVTLDNSDWTKSEDGSLASLDLTFLTENFIQSISVWEIKYSNDGGSLEDAVTGLYVKYEHIAGEEEPIVITKQPTDGEAKLGERYCVEVLAEGEGLKYQWYFRNEGASNWNKSSVTDNTYDDVMTTARMNREVYCVITDASGNTVTTETAKLLAIKTADLAITKEPESVTVNYGERLTLTVEAVGDGVTYEWYYLDPDGAAWLSANVRSATYSATMSKKTDGRAVYCVATDIWGEMVATGVAMLSCERAELAITQQPANASAKLDEMFNVEVFAEGDGLKYQWYWRTKGQENWNVSGQRDNSYDDVMTSARHNREVYCVITDAWGNSLETDVATITGISEVTLAITRQPANVSAKLDEMFNVEFLAEGDGLKYQWYWRTKGQENWNVSGQRDNSYDDVMTSARHNREVYCVITDAWGESLETEVALITGIPEVTLSITRQPESQTVTLGDMFNVNFEAVGDGLKYQWYFKNSGTDTWYKSGQRDNSYDDVMTKARHDRSIYCVVTDAWGYTVTTETVLITAAPKHELAITAQPNDASAKLGENFCVTVEAQGDELRYQWYWRTKGQENWNVSGQRDNTYDDVMTKARHNREVYCVITDMWGKSAETEIALITGIPTATLAITQQPTDAEAALGETFCAGVEAQGDGLSYQWYFRNAGSSVWHKSGVTDNTYDDVMTKTRAGREVYCVITDAWGNTVTTETVTLIRTET